MDPEAPLAELSIPAAVWVGMKMKKDSPLKSHLIKSTRYVGDIDADRYYSIVTGKMILVFRSMEDLVQWKMWYL